MNSTQTLPSFTRSLFAFALLAGTMGDAVASQKQAAPQKTPIESTVRMVVAGFSSPQGFSGTWQPASHGLTDMMTTELVSRGGIVLERRQMADSENEMALGQGGLVDGATSAPMGQMLGAQWRIVVTTTRFGLLRLPVGRASLLPPNSSDWSEACRE